MLLSVEGNKLWFRWNKSPSSLYLKRSLNLCGKKESYLTPPFSLDEASTDTNLLKRERGISHFGTEKNASC